jgi:hypothetical protein
MSSSKKPFVEDSLSQAQEIEFDFADVVGIGFRKNRN